MDDREYRFIFEKDRLESFKHKWKTLKGFKHCTPARFAAAGFYNAGTIDEPDNVKCFFCRKELSNWEKDDDPWEEHKKRGKDCLFMQLRSKDQVRVRDFVQLFFEMRKRLIQDNVTEKLKEFEQNVDMLTNVKRKDKKKKH